jgi:hypothetical protein
MPQETTTTATKDPWAACSARPAGHSIGELVEVETKAPAPLPAPSTVTPQAFPGLALAIPVEVAHQIDALTKSALDGAGIADLPAFEELATETTFGPDTGRLVKAGLGRPLAASVARWGSALYHLGTRLADARTAAQWASDATGRAVERRDEVDAAELIFIRRRAGQWGGGGLCTNWRNHVADRPDIAPPERDAAATHARLVAYQVEGRLRHLLSTGGIPCRMAVALAATFDGAGWSETACMLAGEMTGAAITAIAPAAFTAGPKLRRSTSGLAKREVTERARLESWIASVAHDAVRWAEHAWRTADAAPTAMLLPASLPVNL